MLSCLPPRLFSLTATIPRSTPSSQAWFDRDCPTSPSPSPSLPIAPSRNGLPTLLVQPSGDNYGVGRAPVESHIDTNSSNLTEISHGPVRISTNMFLLMNSCVSSSLYIYMRGLQSEPNVNCVLYDLDLKIIMWLVGCNNVM